VTTLGETAEQALRVVREAPVMAYDTETSGLNWKIHNPVGYVITTADFNAYIPIRHGGGGNLMDPHCGPLRSKEEPIVIHRFERELADAFEHRRRLGYLTIGHNTGFDMHMSANAGVLLGRRCGDTSINAAMLDEFAHSFSLDGCARQAGVTAKYGTELYKLLAQQFGCKEDKTSMEHFWRLSGDEPLVVQYATGDGTTTLELWDYQMKEIEAQEMQFIHRVESDLIYTVFRIERRGVRVNPEQYKVVEDEIDRQLALARLKLPKNLNANSSTQIRRLFEDANITNWPTTPASEKFPEGQASFPEKWLKKSELGRAVVGVRKLSKLNSSFMHPLRDTHTFKGRVHAQLNQLKGDEYGTISGRFSCSNPNLQQIPKRDKQLGPLFRSIFVPDEGMEFHEGDYSQAEPRLFAHYSAEPALVDGYSRNPPLDMHHVVAQNFNCERDPTAKRMNMGILTGMQVDSFAAHMDWPRDKAQEEFDRWFELFPGIKKFQDHAKGVFRSSGYVRTLLKRRCRLDHPRFAYRATSRIIQGGGADIMKERLLRCDEYLESEGDYSHLLMSVHDSFEWEAYPDEKGKRHSQEIVRIACDLQGPPFSLRVPFLMDVGTGPNWAIATYGDLARSLLAKLSS
jgi:DNA polymerase I-like protein with 3'-5' exonuclease and polymerase domains